MNTEGTPVTMSARNGSLGPLEVIEDRLGRIEGLQLQAIYPLDTVAGVWAQSQLAQVEVPWLVRTLRESLLSKETLDQRLARSCERCGGPMEAHGRAA
ncbi:hypothetical protein J2Y41_003903 [Arthrobacter sp. 1088]|uniref:hypothetical protein n=1 Tax=Arthrobacter sp. 1088 TaxID=2817768 RepID=UPI002857E592|nr:hypothetical protein [Arthrobacter sp. 1088]MDR6688317.1 hypothetical protein [Arthrobacter sp. 1088]